MCYVAISSLGAYICSQAANETIGRKWTLKLSTYAQDSPLDLLNTFVEEVLPKQNFEIPIQATFRGKVVARETISAMRKDVTAGLYGGKFGLFLSCRMQADQHKGHFERKVRTSVIIWIVLTPVTS